MVILKNSILKTTLSFLLMLGIIQGVLGQEWSWINKIEGDRCEAITDLQLMPEGDIIATGIYEDYAEATFQSQDDKQVTVAAERDTFPHSHASLFLARYTPEGNLVWVTTALAEDGIHPWHLHIDKDGNSIISGNFRGIATFFSANGKSKVVRGLRGTKSKPPLNTYVAKYDPSGNLLWVKLGLSTTHNVAFESYTDSLGNVYTRAYCHYGSVSFDNNVLLSSTSSGKYFYNLTLILIKYNPSGDLLWIFRGGNVRIEGMHLDPSGNAELWGYPQGEVMMATSQGKVYTYQHEDDKYKLESTIFRINSEGELYAVERHFPSIKDALPTHWVRDTSGNHYALLMPNLSQKVEFVNYKYTWGDEEIISKRKDIFLAKFDKDRKPLWYALVGGENEDTALDLRLDKKGNVLLAGDYYHQTTFIDKEGNKTVLDADEKRRSAFVASFSSEGTFNWAVNTGNIFRKYDGNVHLLVDEQNRLFVASTINAPTRIGNTDLTIKGKKGWISPGWKEEVDYGEYTDAFIAAMNVGDKESSQEDSTLLVASRLIDYTKVLTEQKLSYQADTIFQQAENAPVLPNSGEIDLWLYPNPAKAQNATITVEIKLYQAQEVRWQLFDTNAKNLDSGIENLEEGLQQFFLTLRDYPPGTYFLSITIENKIITKQIILI